jgi:hypothetical protein
MPETSHPKKNPLPEGVSTMTGLQFVRAAKAHLSRAERAFKPILAAEFHHSGSGR